jgi:hypothetical protein
MMNMNKGFLGVIAIVAVVSFMVFSSFANAATVSFAGNSMEANGDAAMAGSVLRLTPNSGGQVGSAFINTPFGFNADSSFSTSFQFRISSGDGSGGADGLAFILQNAPAGMDALAGGGENIGYGTGITNSLAVEFDTYQNGFDPNSNHIGVDTNGNMTSLTTYNSPPDLNSGSLLYAWVDYDGTTDLLEVYINTTNSKPGSPVISQVVDIYSLVGSQVYVGFSAGSGLYYNIHDIEAWDFNGLTSPIPTMNEWGMIIFMALAVLGSIYYLRRKKIKD